MKTILLILFTSLFTSLNTHSTRLLTSSVVVKRLSSCDYFLLYNKSGYVVAEHMGGHEFDEGKVVYGNINSYGTKDIYDEDLDEKEHVYIEDWGLSKSDAIEKLLDKCN